ncbi:MAG: hypothetical protein KAU01_02040 [Candidatus Cloacimonetes bacterium]|nr:hypothetical protein [Candidatus Cloacimonadota bacterium]
MISDYNPIEYLTRIQSLKYKAATVPILIVIISFSVNLIFKIDLVKYFSLLGLLLFLFILMKYRIKRTVPSESEEEIVLAPIHGRIIKIEDNKILIKKSFLDPADIRCVTNNKNVKITITNSSITWFEKNTNLLGKLIGIVPHSAECICELPNDYKIEVQVNQKIEAGETIIARKN